MPYRACRRASLFQVALTTLTEECQALASCESIAAVSVHAQSRTRIEANIPFDFAIGDARLKAGQYIADFADTEKLVVTSVDGKIKVFALAPGILEPKRNDPSKRLVFHRYGNLYFLSQAWISGNGNGLYLSRAERRLARQLAKTNGKLETAKILARTK